MNISLYFGHILTLNAAHAHTYAARGSICLYLLCFFVYISVSKGHIIDAEETGNNNEIK